MKITIMALFIVIAVACQPEALSPTEWYEYNRPVYVQHVPDRSECDRHYHLYQMVIDAQAEVQSRSKSELSRLQDAMGPSATAGPGAAYNRAHQAHSGWSQTFDEWAKDTLTNQTGWGTGGLAYCGGRLDAFRNPSVCSSALSQTPEDGNFYYYYGAIEYCLAR